MAGQDPRLLVRHADGIVCVEFLDEKISLDHVQPIEQETAQIINVLSPPHLVFDFGKVRYIPTTALGMLVAIQTRVRKKGGRLCMTSLDPRIKELFAFGKLDLIFNVYDNIEAAMQSFSSTDC